ncbi:Pentatricopeptide repeat-containing protein [Zea mays]|uniref:Pentatricopeptide repeat-containing protein n=1 Tax=Zea mays TaxID=4577 RepID=A0A1D6PCD5_MAIZE|nr:Pentatricopeptide repeat-containing protein [Zea mays]
MLKCYPIFSENEETLAASDGLNAIAD